MIANSVDRRRVECRRGLRLRAPFEAPLQVECGLKSLLAILRQARSHHSREGGRHVEDCRLTLQNRAHHFCCSGTLERLSSRQPLVQHAAE